MQDSSPQSRQHLGRETRERIAEIGEILALGLVRLKDRQSREVWADGGESSLACVAHQSGHRNTELERMG
jgi:hypothetical protein